MNKKSSPRGRRPIRPLFEGEIPDNPQYRKLVNAILNEKRRREVVADILAANARNAKLREAAHDMTPITDKGYEIITGDCLDVLPSLAECSFDSCVCDPPYELGLMGKAWDKSGIAYRVDLWREVLRVLKPGAYLLAFGGSRTYHRMACAIEDAGFEIRDQIQWIYGSGFPKSLDVGKQLDKEAGAKREVIGKTTHPDGKPRNLVGRENGVHAGGQRLNGVGLDITLPASDDAKTWDGWGTALKPAHEPIVMARKPLERGLTVAQNVLKWGTGAINVDAGRVGTSDLLGGGAENPDTDAVRKAEGWHRPWMDDKASREAHSATVRANVQKAQALGRFPANVIHDGSDEVLAGFPVVSSGQPAGIKAGGQGNAYGEFAGGIPVTGFGDSGSAARFFYTAKASKHDREAGLNGGRNIHPTVKPTDLMQYLIRLVTPPGGLVLDPFLGSGSTMKAALIQRFKCTGIELDPAYAEIAQARCRGDHMKVKLF